MKCLWKVLPVFCIASALSAMIVPNAFSAENEPGNSEGVPRAESLPAQSRAKEARERAAERQTERAEDRSERKKERAQERAERKKERAEERAEEKMERAAEKADRAREDRKMERDRQGGHGPGH